MKNQPFGKKHEFSNMNSQKGNFVEDPIRFKMNSNLGKLRGSIVFFAKCGIITWDEAEVILKTNSISQEVARKILRAIEVSEFGKKRPGLISTPRTENLSKYNCN